MKFSAVFHRRLHWLNLPGTLLIALLQRTPVVRVVATAGDYVLTSPVSAILKAAATTLGALGAVHSMAGATTLSATPSSPATATVGMSKTIVMTIAGAETPPASFTVGGTVPPGMTFAPLSSSSPGVTSGTVNASTIQLSGTPTAPGRFSILVKGWEGANATLISSTTFTYVIQVAAAANTAPTITMQPSSATVLVGGTVSLSAAAAGSPAPTLQWYKANVAITGQITSTLFIFGATATDAGSYALIATNSLGSATSDAATLTVGAAAVAPTINAQPASASVTNGGGATFTVKAGGTAPLDYQWSRGGVAIFGATSASYTIGSAQSSDAGSYTVVVTNTAGFAMSSVVTLTVTGVVSPPVFLTTPANVTVAAGGSALLTVSATNSPAYQWRKNGVAITGATNATLNLTNLATSDTGNYDAVVTNYAGTAISAAANLIVTGPLAARLSNLSVRTTLAANQILIVGLTVTGGGGRSVLLRAVGPGLGALGVLGTMVDPKLTLFNGTAPIAANDNWGDTAANATAVIVANSAVGAFALPVASLDAALVAAVDGGRTIQVSGPAAGNVIVEAYDTGTTNSPRLTNLSALNQVGTGGDVLIAGFTVAGSGTKNLLIRAVGPTLAAAPFNIGGTLADPKFVVRRSSDQAIVGENDNYAASLSTVFTSVGAFQLTAGAKDAALILSLPASAAGTGYTVTVSGADGGTGLAIIEVYELP
jgi:hypothetical protein